MYFEDNSKIYIMLARLLKLSGHSPKQVAEMLTGEKGREFVDFWNEICKEREKIRKAAKKK